MANHPNRVARIANFTYAGNIATIFVGEGRVAEQAFASGPTFNNVPAERSFQTNDIAAMVNFTRVGHAGKLAAALAAAAPGDQIYVCDFE